MTPPSEWLSRSTARRVLVVRLDNIGDVVLLSSTLRALHEDLPQASITLLASPAGAQAAGLLPWVDEVVTWRTLWQDASGALPFEPARELALIEALRARAFDAAIICTSFSQTAFPAAYACYLAGIPVRIGHGSDFAGGVLSHQVPPPDASTHQAERDLHLIEAVGVPVHDRASVLALRPAIRLEADGLLRSAGITAGKPFVALVPGASAAARRYEAGRFALAARAISHARGLPVVVLGSDAERSLAEAVCAGSATERVVSLAGRTSIETFAALLERARVVIANNSAAMHIADAFRRPLAVTYSGTDLASQWRPRNSPAVMLSRPTPCAPCYGFRCARVGAEHLRCLDVSPSEVAVAALSLQQAAPEEQGRDQELACAS